MIKEFRPLQSPFIKVNAEVVMNGKTNGKPTIKKESRYEVSPSAKKIATYSNHLERLIEKIRLTG